MDKNQLQIFPDGFIWEKIDGEIWVRVDALNRNIWASSKAIQNLLGVTRQQVSNQWTAFENDDKEGSKACVHKLCTERSDGKLINMKYYSLDFIVFCGFTVHATEKAIAFRKKATEIIADHIFASSDPAKLEEKIEKLLETIERQNEELSKQKGWDNEDGGFNLTPDK